jgi:hypothetical protein
VNPVFLTISLISLDLLLEDSDRSDLLAVCEAEVIVDVVVSVVVFIADVTNSTEMIKSQR